MPTTRGREIAADIEGIGLSLTMNIEVFRGALKTNVGIVTNEFLETSVGRLAAGDVAEFFDVVTQRYHRMSTDNALNHGKHVPAEPAGGARGLR